MTLHDGSLTPPSDETVDLSLIIVSYHVRDFLEALFRSVERAMGGLGSPAGLVVGGLAGVYPDVYLKEN